MVFASDSAVRHVEHHLDEIVADRRSEITKPSSANRSRASPCIVELSVLVKCERDSNNLHRVMASPPGQNY